MADKKKILMVHNYYQIGGGEHTVFENEVGMLRQNGHEVVTYTRSNDELKENKMKILFLPFTTIWSVKTYVEVRRIIKKESIELVHCHNTFPLISPSVYYAARSLKVPIVQTIHNFRFLCPAGIFYCNGSICEECSVKGNFFTALKNKCYRNSTLQTMVVIAMLKLHRVLGTYKKISYIFLTQFVKEKFKDFIDIQNSQVFIKPNFVKAIGEGQNEDKRETKKTKFIFAGRLEENKGLVFLINTWKKLCANYELHIYGDGPLRNLVEQSAREANNIKYFGFQSREMIFNDLRTAKAMLCTSTCYETFGLTIAESFSMGRPVISSDIGNQGELVVASKGGAVFSLKDEGSFQRAVEKVLDNNATYSRQAKEYYETYLNEKYNYRKLREIYDQVRYID